MEALVNSSGVVPRPLVYADLPEFPLDKLLGDANRADLLEIHMTAGQRGPEYASGNAKLYLQDFLMGLIGSGYR